MRARFHPEAANEFSEAARFYKDRGLKLGKRFSAEVRAAITRIVEAPERWSFFEQDVRRHRVNVFPYLVLYTVEPDCVLIIAVMHGKREPGYWKHRLRSKPQ